MSQHCIKITYHLGGKKINTYLDNTSLQYVKGNIEAYLFDDRQLPLCEIRTFWIDEDQDEIEILKEADFNIFKAKCPKGRLQLHVAPTAMTMEEQPDSAAAAKTSATYAESSSNQAKVPPAAGSYDFAVHENVECDACLMAPIMGFRYKCIQCPNYDLCQNCESKHIHPEHMMVRMPTNNCPNVIEAYVTGRTARRHGKRSKTSCPFVKNGLSVIINDDETETANAADGESAEQASPANGKERHYGRKHHRRHHRHNFFSHLYEMMNDLAEGGGSAAAAHVMGESTSSNKSTPKSTGPQTAATTPTTSNVPVFETAGSSTTAAAAAAAAQAAHETAVKAAEIAAKVAHETAVQAAKNITENMTSPKTANSTAAETGQKERGYTETNIDATTSPRAAEPQPKTVPVIPSPSLESLAQFLDPQYMKTGIQILNNFSDMFAKMLDPMDTSEEGDNQSYSDIRKNSVKSTKSSVSSNLNSVGSGEKSLNEKTIEKDQIQESTKESKQTESDVSSHVEIDDLGSDSENESVSESFIKLDAPKEATPPLGKSGATSAQTTPPPTLDKSKTMDFAQLSADLKAHIAEEAAKESTKSIETAVDATADSIDNTNNTSTINSTTTASEPVVTASTSSTSKTSSTNTVSNKNEEKRAVPVYHADQRINNAVLAMMSMGFSNEGAWLTQLLESVNGNISEALDLMSVAQRDRR